MLYEISLPQSVKINVNSKRKIIRLHKMKGASGVKSALDFAVSFYSKNTEAIFIELSTLEDLKTIYNLRYKNIGIIYNFKEKDLAEFSSYEKIFKAYEIKVIVDDIKTDRVISVIKEITKYDVEVELSFTLFSKLSAKEWEEVAKEIILNPHIVHRVEPLFSMTYYLYQKQRAEISKATLWKVIGEEVEKNLYIDEDENITLSKRWANKGKYFASLDDKSIKIKEGEFYKKLQTYEQNLFFTNMECSMCEYYGYCKASLKFENSGYDCSGFKNALDIVSKNFDRFKVDKKEIA